jgi:hypothetical protein
MAKAAGNKKAWYQQGEEGRKRAREEDAAAQARREQRGPRRFYLPNDASGKITFLDTPNFFLHEHNIKLAGKFNNFFTCLKEIDTCPNCEDGDNPSYVCVGTCISHREWKDKEGKLHKNEKMLFVSKGRARQRLMKQIERREGDLKFCVYEMARGSQTTECNTGEDFEFIKRLTKKQLLGLAPAGSDESWLDPYDYAEILAPKTPEEIRKAIGGSPPVGSEEEGGGEDKGKKDKKDKDNGKKKKKDEDEDPENEGGEGGESTSIEDLI